MRVLIARNSLYLSRRSTSGGFVAAKFTESEPRSCARQNVMVAKDSGKKGNTNPINSWLLRAMGLCQSKKRSLEEKLTAKSEHLDERELVDSWLDTLQRATNDDEKFTLYKILVEFFEDRGHFWNMAGYAQKQFDLVRNSVNKEHLLCGSLNLARAKLFLGDHSEAAKMANYSLSMLENIDLNAVNYRFKVDALLTAGGANIGCSRYSIALGHLDAALRLSHMYSDKVTEALTCCLLSQLYFQLRDEGKGTFYPMKADSLLARFGEHWDEKSKCTIMLSVAYAERKSKKLDSAMARCEEAMAIAHESNDRATQAHTILCFADIHRQRMDNDAAIPRYKAALKMFQDNGDSMGKLRAQIGLAKCLIFKKDQREASHFYQLAVATCHQTENKSYAIKIYEDLIIIETHNNLVSNIDRYTSLLRQALKEMRIKCGACLEYIGDEATQLEALNCTHFFHTDCVQGGISVCRCCQQNVYDLRPIN
ncbi:unnamed protein product [Oikopleura dioica]|uniref:RING-type domain-containing protein n=1 Tax=Oikopleura dioica TaxID=34765 RepID=E4YKZ0_OIKDI|nr:unnamed protein product [Oikopleura dioica]CBY39312.1 unnamed protein product [Oikopleura dioica]